MKFLQKTHIEGPYIEFSLKYVFCPQQIVLNLSPPNGWIIGWNAHFDRILEYLILKKNKKSTTYNERSFIFRNFRNHVKREISDKVTEDGWNMNSTTQHQFREQIS